MANGKTSQLSILYSIQSSTVSTFSSMIAEHQINNIDLPMTCPVFNAQLHHTGGIRIDLIITRFIAKSPAESVSPSIRMLFIQMLMVSKLNAKHYELSISR